MLGIKNDERKVEHNDASPLFVDPSKTIKVALSQADSDNEDATIHRLTNLLYTFPHKKLPYLFGPHGLCYKTSASIIVQYAPIQKNLTILPNAIFSTTFNISQLNERVDQADKQSNGLFRKANRLISFWNYQTKERKNPHKKYFRSVHFIILTLNWFHSVQNHPPSLSKFILDALSHALKNMNETIFLEYKGEKLTANILHDFSSKKQALGKIVQAIKDKNWSEFSPRIQDETTLESFSIQIKVDINEERINKLTQWISEMLGDLMKKVTFSGSMSRGTAIKNPTNNKNFSDIDFHFYLKDEIEWETSQQIESTLKIIFQRLREDKNAVIRLQRHSIFIETLGASFDLVIVKAANGKNHPMVTESRGIRLFELDYKQPCTMKDELTTKSPSAAESHHSALSL